MANVKEKQVHTYSFPGATTEDMEFFLKRLIARKPEEIVLHIGTNDLSSYSDEQVTGNIMKLIAEMEKHTIKCTVSSIIIRKGELTSKEHQVNEQLGNKLKTKNITYICNKNISPQHLGKGGLYLNKRGDGALALNLINHICSWDEKVSMSMNRKNPNIKTYIGIELAKGACDNVWTMLAGSMRNVNDNVRMPLEAASINKNGFRMMMLNIFLLMPHLDELRIFVS